MINSIIIKYEFQNNEKTLKTRTIDEIINLKHVKSISKNKGEIALKSLLLVLHKNLFVLTAWPNYFFKVRKHKI